MSLALPTNIARRETSSQILRAMLDAMHGPISYHIRDGRYSFHQITPEEYESACEVIAQCSLVYVLEGTRGCVEPISAFIANEELRNVKLQHLIDDRPSAGKYQLPRRTRETLAVHISSMFESLDWLDLVSVPARIDFVNGMFGLSVQVRDDESCHIRLADAGHRPKSSRTRR